MSSPSNSEILNAAVRDLRYIHAGVGRLDTASKSASAVIRRFSLKTLEIEGEMWILEALMLLQLLL